MPSRRRASATAPSLPSLPSCWAAVCDGLKLQRPRSNTRRKGQTLVHRGPRREARACSNRSDADLGQEGDRYLDLGGWRNRWPGVSRGGPSRPRSDRGAEREGRMATAPAVRPGCRCARNRAPQLEENMRGGSAHAPWPVDGLMNHALATRGIHQPHLVCPRLGEVVTVR